MRKFLLVFILLFILVIHLNAAEEYDFRNVNWGMTKIEVKQSEGQRKVQNENGKSLIYVDTIANQTFGVIYNFVNNKLYSSGYMSLEKHTNENLYIIDYEKMKELLINKYGKPSDRWWNTNKEYNEMIWIDDLYKNKSNEWGFAVSIGDLVYQSCWNTNEVGIVLSLKGDNYKISFGVAYYNKELYKEFLESNKDEDKL